VPLISPIPRRTISSTAGRRSTWARGRSSRSASW
jgi:hypothetical protein